MKSNQILIITFFLFLTLISCSKKVVTGKYRTNFNSYGMFSKTLTLECNGNAILNFQGDMQNNNSFGTWKTEKDTLIIFFDSIKNQNNKFRGELKFVVKRNKLENMPFPKSKYKEMVKYVKRTENDTLKIPSYRKLNKMTTQGLKNFQGETGKQYFKKIEYIECK
ncbi:hypothetical protein [Flavobacterium lacisediminis]|uniref:Lipoprotein n=1 Tax=Flavobacterium lacisediminis TaxID=2989705 RepID=A0ABT3EHW7_9FLAO|nr:hypothetical protein [Flavobacterium lacisediminis]MCW1148176.1 hypothetical protein [Flavobacterium lacisediminis]